MDIFDGYRAAFESLLQRESGDGCNQQWEDECWAAVKALVLYLCFKTGQNVFFTTRDRRIGIGPPQVQKGDTVVLLYGGVTPFVLRRGGVFDALVGDAYVYGAMKGELVEITAKQKDLDGIGPWKDEFFLLG